MNWRFGRKALVSILMPLLLVGYLGFAPSDHYRMWKWVRDDKSEYERTS